MFSKYYSKTKYILLITLIVTLLFCVASCFLLNVSAFAESVPTKVEYNKYEAIIIGDVVNIVAKVTRDGVTKDEPIKYTNFPATEMNKLFNSFTAKGYIDGWNEEIVQTIIVLPKDTQYMINFGGNSTENEYIAPGEGTLGLELDHSGNSGVNEPYFQAILRKFPQLLNKTSAKQYGESTDAFGNWGYVGNEFVGTAKITVKEKDLYEKILFPKRGTDDVQIKTAIPQGKYDIYIGTYSYWFSRPCNISINDVMVAENYQLMPSRQVFKTTVEHTSNAPLSVLLEGNGLYDESMISFLCITNADEGVYNELSSPQAASSIPLTDKQIIVSGLTEGAKLIAYDYSNNNLLFEQVVPQGQTEVTVSLQDWQLSTTLSRIALVQTNKQHTSSATIIQRTDIEDMQVTFADEYTSQNVICNVSGSAPSTIVQVIVKNGEQVVIDRQTNSVASNYNGQFEIEQNGTYDVILVSGSGATSTQTITVSKIDKEMPSISLALNLKSAKQSSANQIVLQVEKATLAPISSFVCIGNNGEKITIDNNASTVAFDSSGIYTLSYTNILGKQTATNVMIALAQQDVKTVALSQSVSGRAVVVNMQSANGYLIDTVTVYATTEDGTEKMIVNGDGGQFNFNMYDKGTYFVQVETKDGSLEVFVLDIAELSKDAPQSGLTIGDFIGIGIMGVSVILVAFSIVLYIKKSKKQSK